MCLLTINILLYFSPILIFGTPLVISVIRTIRYNRRNGYSF